MSGGDFTDDEKKAIREMAERAVKIPAGSKHGRWSREERVALVYAVLCSLFRKGSNKV